MFSFTPNVSVWLNPAPEGSHSVKNGLHVACSQIVRGYDIITLE